MKSPLSPPHDCPLCPRLKTFRDANRAKYPDWFNAPVPNFGPLGARILIAGLAGDAPKAHPVQDLLSSTSEHAHIATLSSLNNN